MFNDRSKLIGRLKADKKFRASYIKAKLGLLVPAQIRALRLRSSTPPMPRQKDLANEAEMHQSRISMFETPGAANVTLETLANIASALRCGLKVEFVPFSNMLKWENDFPQDTFDVVRLDNDYEFINPAAAQAMTDVPAIASFGTVQPNVFQGANVIASERAVQKELTGPKPPFSVVSLAGNEQFPQQLNLAAAQG